MPDMTPPPASDSAPRCARCGASSADATADALCVRCLLGVALATLPDEAGEVAALIGPESLLRRREFAGYELLEELGRGGMGVVFRARQPKLGREVALKVIAAGELASPRMIERFRTEAEAAARLQHPHIVPILDVGSVEGWHYLSMRLVAGGTLAGRLQQGRLPVDAAVRIIGVIARAVHHAHQHGVLHRDLKPTNILLDARGEPHLTDFGLAKIVEHNRDFTLTSAVLGTPAYMAPEQAAGETRDATVAADVYSLGAMFYEMLAGHPPFSAANTPALLRRISEESAPTFHREAGTDHDLEIVALKCLEKNPARRYASAAEFADDLDRWRRGEPILARAATRWERLAKWTRRHPAKAALAVLVPLLLLVITAGSVWFNLRLSATGQALATSIRVTQRQLLSQRLEAAGRLAADHDSYGALLALVPALEIERALGEPVPRARERAELIWQLTPRLVRLWDARGTPATLAFSPDGTRLVATLRHGGARTWDLVAGREISGTDPGPGETTAHTPLAGTLLSPDGRWRSVAADNTAVVSDARTGAVRFKVAPPNVLLDLTFSPDSAFFATASFGGQAEVRTTADGKPHQQPIRHENGANRVLYSPDGLWLATAGFDYRVRLHLARTLLQAAPTLPHGALVDALAFSADGRFFATGDAWGTVRIFDLHLPALVVPPQVSLARKTNVSPDGRRAALLAGSRDVRLWDIAAQRFDGEPLPGRGSVSQAIFDASGRYLAVCLGKGGVRVWALASRRVVLDLPAIGTATAVAFDPAGDRLLVAFDDATGQVWRIADGQPAGPRLVRTAYADGRPYTPTWKWGVVGAESRWSPDGKWIVLAGGLEGATVWDAATGTPVGDPLNGPAEVRAVSFSPDHRRLLLAFNDRNVDPSYARMYALPDLRPLGPPLRHGDGVTGALFAADGAVVVTAGQDSVVRLWHADDGRPAAPEFRHGALINTLSLRPGRDVLATASADRRVRLWDASRGEQIAEPFTFGYGIVTAVHTPDGATLLLGAPNRAARLVHFQRVPWPDDAWQRLAHCLNGATLDERGLRRALTSRELADTFAALRAGQPADFSWPSDSAAWHHPSAALAESERDLFAAAFHLRALLARSPDDTTLAARLARTRPPAPK